MMVTTNYILRRRRRRRRRRRDFARLLCIKEEFFEFIAIRFISWALHL
jgi:hypothetical protein